MLYKIRFVFFVIFGIGAVSCYLSMQYNIFLFCWFQYASFWGWY
nr:MAG TPA: hypothetical protein [Caudoviricetes sp.]